MFSKIMSYVKYKTVLINEMIAIICCFHNCTILCYRSAKTFDDLYRTGGVERLEAVDINRK